MKASNTGQEGQIALFGIALICSFLRGVLVVALNAWLANSECEDYALSVESLRALLVAEVGMVVTATALPLEKL